MDERCEQVLERLWPPTEPGGLETPELVAAREHLEGCTACQAFLCRDENLGRRLRELDAVGSASLPEACRVELQQLLKSDSVDSEADSEVTSIQSRRRIRRPAWTEVAAAAAAIALIAGGLTISRSIEAPLTDGAFTTDFIHTALPGTASGDVAPTQVAAFYAEQFGERMDPARLLDARVTRVTVCEVQGNRGAMVEYELGGERLVYYQLPLDGRRAPSHLHTGQVGRLNVARWGDDRSEHVLVSSLPIENLEEYALERMN